MFWETQMYDIIIIIIITIQWLNENLPIEGSLRYQDNQVSCEKLPICHTEQTKRMLVNSSDYL